MSPFNGFPPGKVHLTPVPATFFSELLPQIDHLGELRVSLYAFWFLDRLEGNVRYMTWTDFAYDQTLLGCFGKTAEESQAALKDALERAVLRGTFLRASSSDGDEVYFMNTPRGRAAAEALQRGEWAPDRLPRPAPDLAMERPNIYRLYEENIGPLTPLIAEELRDAEKDYPAEWVEDAVRKAVQANARKWNYIKAILKKWKEDGRYEPDRRDSEQDRRRFFEGEHGDIIQH